MWKILHPIRGAKKTNNGTQKAFLICSRIQTNAISAPAIGRHLVFAIIHHAALVSIGLYTPTPPPPHLLPGTAPSLLNTF
jgi:hypothetical protein